MATLTLSGTHGWAIGDIVEIVSVGGTGYNGVAEITAVTSNTISYASIGTNEGSTADTAGTVYQCM